MRAVAVALSVALAGAAAGPAFGQFGYALVGQFELPSGAQAWDVGSDGRVWTMVGRTVFAQQASGAGGFAPVGSVAAGTVAAFGASFIRVDQGGERVAIGDNNFGSSARVHVVTTAALGLAGPGGATTSSVLLGNFDAAWNGNQLYVTGAGSDFVPFVSRVDFADVTGQPVATRIITGVGGASGGVAVLGGTLVTGVGYAGGGFATGDLRLFDLGDVESAGSPVSYGTGQSIAGGPVLSASPVAFDAAGRLLIGGGDAFGGTTDIGYIAVIDLLSGVRQLLSPAGSGETYSVDFNPVSEEVYVRSGSTIYRYAVPLPGTAGMLMMLGLACARRNRRG